MNKNIAVGDRLFLVINNFNGLLRNLEKHNMYECVVTKIGRLYFKVAYGKDLKRTKEFSLKTFYERGSCTQNAILYSSKEEYDNIIKTALIKVKIRSEIIGAVQKMSFEDLEIINNIIKKYVDV